MDTKERILQRTGELFSLIGLKGLTMDYIAVDLGVSKRTIYEIFQDKDELILQAIEYQIRQNNLKLLEIVKQTENVVEAIFVIIELQFRQMNSFNPIILEDIKKYLVRLNVMYYANREKCREFSVSYALLDKGIKEGVFREELKLDVVDGFIFELANLFHHSEGIRQMKLTRTDALNNILFPYFRGICTRKGLELMDVYIGKLENL